MTQGRMRVVAAVFLAVLGACGPVVEPAEATRPTAPSALATGSGTAVGCEAGHVKCVGGCKAEHKRCQTQVTVLCAPEPGVIAGCLAEACPTRELLGCTRDCAAEYAECTALP
jgi:hypothetical protein